MRKSSLRELERVTLVPEGRVGRSRQKNPQDLRIDRAHRPAQQVRQLSRGPLDLLQSAMRQDPQVHAGEDSLPS